MEVILDGESFLALSEALQNALGICVSEKLNNAPTASAADFATAMAAMQAISLAASASSAASEIATRNNRGISDENGAIESPYRQLTRLLEQQQAFRD